VKGESVRARGGIAGFAGFRTSLIRLAALAAAVVLLAVPFWPTGGGRQELQLTFSSLAPLANGYQYEGWAVLDGRAWSTGRFNVGPNGELVDVDGNSVRDGVYDAGRDLSDAAMIAITIQPPIGSAQNPAPDEDGFGGDAPPHLLAGEVVDLTAVLSPGAGPALGNTFADASGSYVLDHGHVHFTNLDLPALPPGWAYETWAAVDGVTESLGRFGQTEGGGHAEHDPAANTAETGSVQAPPHLAPRSDIRGGTLFISIEPSPDDSPLPYSLRPLSGKVPTEAQDGTAYALQNGSAAFPTGTARIK
jgi:hypothetical protein